MATKKKEPELNGRERMTGEQMPELIERCVLVLEQDGANWANDGRATQVRDAISNLCYSTSCCVGAGEAVLRLRKEVFALADELGISYSTEIL